MKRRGEAPAIYLAQPEGLGDETSIYQRAKGLIISPTRIFHQFRSHVFHTTIETRLDSYASHDGRLGLRYSFRPCQGANN